MELADYAGILRKRWRVVLIVTLLSVAFAAALTLMVTPRYSTTVRLFVATHTGESVAELTQGSAFTEKQMASYAEVVTTPLVLDDVIGSLKLDTSVSAIAHNLEVSIPPGTVLLDITAYADEPNLAADVANAVASSMKGTVAELSPDRPDGSETVVLEVVTPAPVPVTPTTPDTARNLAVGTFLGLALGLAGAVLRELVDTRVRTAADVRRITDAPILGSIPASDATAVSAIYMQHDPQGPQAEAVRQLRTNLQFYDFSTTTKSIMITSSVPGEGKTTTAINLAAALADSGARVLLVDADLRRPSVATYLGIEGRVGLTTVLIGRASLADVVQNLNSSTLDVLAAGQVPPNPSELLGSRAMQQLLVDVAESYDAIVLDTAPLIPVTDAAVLSRAVGVSLVVAGMDRLRRAELEESMRGIEQAGSRLAGIALNKIDERRSSSYSYRSYRSETTENSRMEMRSPATRQATWPGRPLNASTSTKPGH